jgi:hypothetical protein
MYGLSRRTVASYVSGTDFSKGQFYHETVYRDKGTYTFPTNMRIQFMCNASDDSDDIYIDEIKVSGK